MSKGIILIVDDAANIRNLLDLNITAAGFTTLLAQNGREGLELLQTHPVALVVLDVMMPEMDGWEFCKIVRDHPRLSQTKILMLTAKDSPRDRLIGKEILQADEYMTKPFEINVLLAEIEKQLGALS